MLNPFPIQFLALFAYAILRFFAGVVLVHLGIKHIQNRYDIQRSITLPLFSQNIFFVWNLALFELVAGAMFITGFYVQYAAIIVFAMAIKILVFRKYFASVHIPSKLFYVLLTGVSLSLFITGGGIFGFDLPI